MDYLLIIFATDQSIAENDAAILRYVPLFILTPQKQADRLIATLRKDVDVYDDSALNDVVIEGIDACI